MSEERDDYSRHYSRFHPDTPDHDATMVSHMVWGLSPFLPLEREGAVLDIGCGFGFAMLAMKQMGFSNVTGIDISPQQAERAKSKGLDVEAVEDSETWLAAHPRKFSTILLLDVLEHIPEKEQIKFLRGVRKSLAQGGRLITHAPNANSPLASRWRYIDHTHFTSFTEHSLHYVLASAGFDEIHIDGEKGIGRFPKRLWRRGALSALRKYLVRWCWLQVYKAELPNESVQEISFELNLKAVAFRLSEDRDDWSEPPVRAAVERVSRLESLD